ncbi:nuclear transport factor 2 family protein [Paraburkholderia sp. C35]|uniref:nuclear transport factor 2 family protein n=1 Tax=Paraburkholderia sp. C35 TaxID=2126993 RepID=UPI0013A54788|nr:nuclear transport factor 2 family protein [Paraburkholderia sp. C35]
MSNEKLVNALKAAFVGYESNDKEPLFALLPSDFVFEQTDCVPYGGRYEGPDEFRGYWREVGKKWKYFRYNADDIIDAGDTLIVVVKTDALSVDDIVMRNDHLFLFKAKDGVPTYCRLYADTGRARDVLEGREPRKYPKPDLSKV